MKQAGIAAFALAALFAITPATAKVLSCTNDNMQKSYADAHGMPDSPQKMAMMISMRIVVSQNPTVVGGSVMGVDQYHRISQ